LTKIFHKFSFSLLHCLFGRQQFFQKLKVEARFSRVIGAESFEDSSDAQDERDKPPKSVSALQGERVGYNG